MQPNYSQTSNMNYQQQQQQEQQQSQPGGLQWPDLTMYGGSAAQPPHATGQPQGSATGAGPIMSAEDIACAFDGLEPIKGTTCQAAAPTAPAAPAQWNSGAMGGSAAVVQGQVVSGPAVVSGQVVGVAQPTYQQPTYQQPAYQAQPMYQPTQQPPVQFTQPPRVQQQVTTTTTTTRVAQPVVTTSEPSGGKGMVVGGAIGCLVLGPVGAVIGAVVGNSVGKEREKKKGTVMIADDTGRTVQVQMWRTGETAPLNDRGLALVIASQNVNQMCCFCHRVAGMRGCVVNDQNRLRMVATEFMKIPNLNLNSVQATLHNQTPPLVQARGY